MHLKHLEVSCGSIPYGLPREERKGAFHLALRFGGVISRRRDCATNPLREAAGEELGLSGGLSTSVMVRVSSKADSLTGIEATTRPIFRGVPLKWSSV